MFESTIMYIVLQIIYIMCECVFTYNKNRCVYIVQKRTHTNTKSIRIIDHWYMRFFCCLWLIVALKNSPLCLDSFFLLFFGGLIPLVTPVIECNLMFLCVVKPHLHLELELHFFTLALCFFVLNCNYNSKY